MNWLNLEIKTLTSPEFLGSDPVDRATWICLLSYCAQQENSGIIKDCSSWSDRKWQQLVGVTKAEIERETSLWELKANNVKVFAYPKDQQDKVISNRINGKKGGRPPSEPTETINKPCGYDSVNHVPQERLNVKGKESNSNSNSNKKEIEIIYEAYPKKVSKGEALKAIKKALTIIPFEELLPIVKVYAEKTSWQDKQYIPNPSTWFNQQKWLDDQSVWEKPQEKSTSEFDEAYIASYVNLPLPEELTTPPEILKKLREERNEGEQ